MRCQRTCVHEFVWIDHNNHLDFSLWLRFDWPNVYVVFNFYYLKREQITAYNLFILKKYFYVWLIQDCESFVPIAKLFCVNVKSVLKILKRWFLFHNLYADNIKMDNRSWFSLWILLGLNTFNRNRCGLSWINNSILIHTSKI